jgi:hypothetical protein
MLAEASSACEHGKKSAKLGHCAHSEADRRLIVSRLLYVARHLGGGGAVGFKLMIAHHPEPQRLLNASYWRAFLPPPVYAEPRPPKIIVLQRRNEVARLLSMTTARLEHRWSGYVPHVRDAAEHAVEVAAAAQNATPPRTLREQIARRQVTLPIGALQHAVKRANAFYKLKELLDYCNVTLSRAHSKWYEAKQTKSAFDVLFRVPLLIPMNSRAH